MEIKKFYDLKNADEVREQLESLIRDYAIACNRYQTDVYLYVDDDGNGRLEEFENPGGNSWLNDDHYVLYTDKESCDGIEAMYDSVESIARACGKTLDDLRKECATKDGADVEDVEDYDIYALAGKEYKEELRKDAESWIDCFLDYKELSGGAIDSFDAELERRYFWAK